MIIGLSGPAFVGKSTVAGNIIERHGGVVLSYASPLKDALITLTGFDRKIFTDKDEKLIPRMLFGGKSSRQVMQLFGTEFCRMMLREDFWLILMSCRIANYPDENIVIDDVRFQDEANLIQESGGFVIELSRASVKYDRSHASEQGVVADYHINLPLGLTEAKNFLLKEISGFGAI